METFKISISHSQGRLFKSSGVSLTHIYKIRLESNLYFVLKKKKISHSHYNYQIITQKRNPIRKLCTINEKFCLHFCINDL